VAGEFYWNKHTIVLVGVSYSVLCVFIVWSIEHVLDHREFVSYFRNLGVKKFKSRRITVMERREVVDLWRVLKETIVEQHPFISFCAKYGIVITAASMFVSGLYYAVALAVDYIIPFLAVIL
jgi:hypothetical protein